MPGPTATIVGQAMGAAVSTLTFTQTVGANQSVYLWLGGRIAGTTAATYTASGGADSWETITFGDDVQNVHQFGLLKANNPVSGSVTVTVVGQVPISLAAISIGFDTPNPQLAYKVIDTGATDTATISADLDVTAPDSTVVLVGTSRLSDLVVPSSETLLLTNTTIVGGGQASYFWAAKLNASVSEGTTTVSGTLASPRDWSAVALAVAGGGSVSDITPAADSLVNWWNGSSLKAANFMGWWDGNDFAGGEVLGWWNGTKIIPLVADAPVTEPPAAPVLAVPTVSGSTVNLSWSNVPTATGYAVYRDSTQVGAPTGAPVDEPLGTASTLVNRWVGGVTAGEAKVSVKTTGASQVQIKVSTTSNLTTNAVYSDFATPDAQGISIHNVAGLTANTTYYFGVVADGKIVKDGGQFKTFPSGAASFTFAFSSCQNATTSTAWPRILARNPALFVHLGDMWYDDGASTAESSYHSHYDAKFSQDSGFANVFRKIPVAYVWSDHDFGMTNNAVGSAAGREPAQNVYSQRVPFWNQPDSGGAIYQSFRVGRVQFIITDDRSYKSANSAADNSSKTVLGATQKAWFKDQITKSTASLIIWASDQPWIGTGTSNDDDWFAYGTERTELGNFFAASGKNIAVISGDMHALAFDSGTNSTGNVAVMHAAALNNSSSIKGGPYSAGTYPTSAGATVQQYATCAVTDTGGTSISITYTGYDTSDTARLTSTKTYTTTAAPVVPPPVTGGTTSAGTAPTVVAGTPVTTGTATPTFVDVAVPAIAAGEISVLAVTSTSAVSAVATPQFYQPLSPAATTGSDTNLVSFYRKGPAAATTVRINSGQAATTTSGTTAVTSASSGLFISPSRLMSLPTSGSEFAQMVSKTSGTIDASDFSNNNDFGDTLILACALVGVRNNDTARINKAKAAIDATINTSFNRVLEMSRNIPSVVFAMDVMGYKPTAMMNFLDDLRTKALQGHSGGTNMLTTAWNAANNWGSMSRAAMSAIDLYVGGHAADMQKTANTHSEWLGNDVPGFSNSLRWTSGNDWFPDDGSRFGINKRNAKRDGNDFGGIQPEDQRRSGGYKIPSDGFPAQGYPGDAGETHYPWESLQGVIMASLLMDRAGLLPFNTADYAIQRSALFLTNIQGNAASGDDLSTPWLLNFYGANLPTSSTTTQGKNNAWGAWLWQGQATDESGTGNTGGGTTTVPAVPAKISVIPFKIVGANANNPFPLTVATATQGSGTAPSAPSVTSPDATGLLVNLFATRTAGSGAAAAVTPPSGTTELGEISSSVASGTNHTIEVATQTLSAAGATGTKTATASVAGVSAGVSIFVASPTVTTGGTPVDPGTVTQNTTGLTFSDTRLTAGSYTYTVRAVNAAGNSPASNARTVTVSSGRVAPPTPVGVTATVPAGGNDVTVSWSSAVDADSYTIYRGSTVVASQVTQTSWVDVDLVAGTYSYTVRAVNTVGTSSASSSASVTIAATAQAPAAPTNVNATASTTSVLVTWATVAGATSYDVYRGSTKLATTVATQYNDTGLVAGTYTYTVRATNAGGTSPSSASDSATVSGSDSTGGKGVGLENPIDLGAAPPSAAKYVSPSGSDSAAGTSSAPWKTLGYAFGHVTAGQTLIMRGGTYTENVNMTFGNKGTAGNPIMIRPMPGETPLLVGLLWTKECTYTTIAGLKVTWKSGTDAGSHMVRFKDGSNWRLTQCEFYNAASYAALHVASDIGGQPTNFRIDSCYIHDTKKSNGNNQDHLIYVNNSKGSTGKIERCILANALNGRGVKVGPQPLTADCGGTTIRYNTIYRCTGPSSVQLSYTCSNCEVYRNVMVDTNAPDGGKAANITMYNPSSAKGNTAHDNVGWDSAKVVEVDNSQLADTGGNIFANPGLNTSTWHSNSTYDSKYGRFATA